MFLLYYNSILANLFYLKFVYSPLSNNIFLFVEQKKQPVKNIFGSDLISYLSERLESQKQILFMLIAKNNTFRPSFIIQFGLAEILIEAVFVLYYLKQYDSE